MITLPSDFFSPAGFKIEGGVSGPVSLRSRNIPDQVRFVYIFIFLYVPFLSQNRVTPDNIKEEDRHGFGVCVNILSETWDFSTHLVEWLELLRGFGVARVMAYTLQVDPVSFCFGLPRCTKNLPQVDTNVSRVLAHYQSLGFLHLTPFSLAGHQPNLHLLRVSIFIFI